MPATRSTDTIPTTETAREIRLEGAVVRYLVRRSPRARGLRMSIDQRRGLVVSIPAATRRGWANGDARIDAFLRERQSWVLRHLARRDRERAEIAALGGTEDGSRVHYRGELHRIRFLPMPGSHRRSTVERAGGDAEDELLVRTASGDRRPIERVLEAWFQERATESIARAVALHAPALRVTPAQVVLRDPKSRWGSASKHGRLMFSWRLVLAPPEALETVVVHELAHLRVFGHGPGFWKLVAGRRPDHVADRTWLRKHSHALHAALQPVGGEA